MEGNQQQIEIEEEFDESYLQEDQYVMGHADD